MPVATILGFAGDLLTFLGGVVLALDAVRGERLFKQNRRHMAAWLRTIEDPDLPPGTLTLNDVKLKDENDIERALRLSDLQRSGKWAVAGAVIVTAGFICLLLSRWMEYRHS